MRWMLIAAIIGLSGCKKRVDPSPAQGPVGIDHPDLDCPTGTIGLGEPPPDGTMIYCAKVDPYTQAITKHGPSITWHSPTRRAATGAYANGKKSGPWTYWSPTGALDRKGSYANGKKDGLWVSFHPNGQKKSEGTYVADREEGTWTFWSEDGTTRTEGKFAFGKRVGVWIDYDADGKPLRERTYRNGRLAAQRELAEP